MRKTFLTVAGISLALLISGGLPGAARTAAAEDATKPSDAAMLSPARAFVRLWQKPGGFEKITFASVDGPTLYLGGSPRGLEAVEVETGLTRWMHSGVLPPDFPPIENDKILYLVEGGRLVTLNPATGEELTRAKPRFGFFTPAYPGERDCVFASGEQYVYAVTSDKGAKMWRGAIDGTPTGSTWNRSSLMYFMTSKGILYSVSIPVLEFNWQHQFSREACSPPALAGNLIYVGSADYNLYALDALIGDVRCKLSLSAPVLDTPMIVGSRLYVATTEKLIHAVDLTAQKDLWSIPGERVLTTAAERLIYLRKDKGVNVIGMADAATGKVISEMSAAQYVLFAAPPEGGIFYAVGKTGDVLAMGDRAVIEAREAARAAAQKAAQAAPVSAPSAPATAPSSEPSAAPTAAAPTTEPMAPTIAPSAAPTAPPEAPH
jgi:outer membrane protein assembly factor BamB